MVIIKLLHASPELHIMVKTIIFLFAVALLSACQSTELAHHQTLEQRTLAKRQSNATYAANTDVEPPPPAEGPEDAPEGARDPIRNPALVPSPLLRYSAASQTP